MLFIIDRFTKSESSFDFADTDQIRLGLISADYDRAPINGPISTYEIDWLLTIVEIILYTPL